MARGKSHKTREEEVRTTRNVLEPAYGQTGENRWVIYASYPRPDLNIPKLLVLGFKAKYAAKFFLDQLIEEDGYEHTAPLGSRKCITTGLGIRIAMFKDELATLLEYKPTELEAAWVDDKVVMRVRALKYGVTDEDRAIRKAFLGVEDEPELEGEEKPKREKAEPKPKIDKTGLVSASDIAKELGVDGKDVRVILRSMKLEKPAGGWLFDPKTAAEIKKQVEAGLKEGKKKK